MWAGSGTGSRAAEQQHVREGARGGLFGQKTEQTAHGVPNKDQLAALPAQLPGGLANCRLPGLAPGAPEGFHIRAVAGEKDIAVRRPFRQAVNQELELPGMALDAVNEEET